MKDIAIGNLIPPTQKLAGGFEDDDLPSTCRNPSHNPPIGLYIPEGKRYRHICPGCGFTVVMRPFAVSMEVRHA